MCLMTERYSFNFFLGKAKEKLNIDGQRPINIAFWVELKFGLQDDGVQQLCAEIIYAFIGFAREKMSVCIEA